MEIYEKGFQPSNTISRGINWLRPHSLPQLTHSHVVEESICAKHPTIANLRS